MTCYLFPGQGAQYPGMGCDFYEYSREVRLLFEEASDNSGKDFAKLLFEGSEEELRCTDNTQIAVTLVNLASSRVLAERGIVPDICAGFSLGEYSALYQAGVIERGDLFSLVQVRGDAMERASRALDYPEGSSGMMAVIGLEIDSVKAAIAGIESIYVANHSSPTQVVLSGVNRAMSIAETRLNEAGAMRIVRLKVSGPFHSPLMAAAREEFSEHIANTRFSDPTISVFVNVTGEALGSGEVAKQYCLEQLVSPVQWVASERGIMELSPERVLETGPGTVLSGLWKSLRNGLKCVAAGTLESINKLTY